MGHAIAIIGVVAICTLLTRALPFWIFGGKKDVPNMVKYLGRVLPSAIMVILVVYCLKDINFLEGSRGIPELLAIGMVVNSMSSGTNIDLNSYMFGSILAIDKGEMVLCIVLGIVVIGTFIYFYNPIFAITFDENFARATGLKVELYKTILSVLTAVTIVIGMRIMGTLLISSLIIFPALSAMRVTHKFRTVMIMSVIISMFCFLVGLVASYLMELPTGATIVVSNLCVFIIMTIAGKVMKK